MTPGQARKLTWGLDVVGWLAYADWLDEQANPPESSSLWRRRAKVAAPILEWLANLRPLGVGSAKIVIDDGCWLVPMFFPKTIHFSVWYRKKDRWPSESQSPDIVFPRTHLKNEKYLRRRFFELADRLLPEYVPT